MLHNGGDKGRSAALSLNPCLPFSDSHLLGPVYRGHLLVSMPQCLSTPQDTLKKDLKRLEKVSSSALWLEVSLGAIVLTC